jgi:mono/diheme cytochrome c family protein
MKAIRFIFLLIAIPYILSAQEKQQEPNPVDHAGILKALDKSSLDRGQVIYESLCINCHGSDGKTPTLPVAQAFGTGELRFGTDPYSMFLTLTKGNGLMGPQTWMTPRERYDVIHYIRQKFMKPMHPKYAPVTGQYLAGLPKVNVIEIPKKKKVIRDFGPVLASQLGTDKSSVLTVNLGDAHTLSYNLHTIDQAGVWRGGFLNLSNTQHYRERGGGVPTIEGEPIEGLQTWKWAHKGSFDYPTKDLLPRGPLPAKWMHYRGHYLHGDQLVMSYSINDREIMEMPAKAEGFGAIVHTLQVGPGPEPLQLAVAQMNEAGVRHGFLDPGAPTVKLDSGNNKRTDQIAVSRMHGEEQAQRFTAAAIFGAKDGLRWNFDSKSRIVLTIPASTKSRLFQVIRYSGPNDAQLLSMAGYLRLLKLKDRMPDPAKLLKGGPARWPDVFTTKGKTGKDDKAYTLDTLTLPSVEVPGNVWFRTSALAFFPDGRMVICTHGGDVWIVSDIDKALKALKWKRFAAGMYEPFGLQVIDGQIYVTCKDRLTRLHDYNDDGEADFYESFSADTDVSTFFHAFNFDLQRDKDGNLYYIKSGQYTSHALPGAVIKVSPDGSKREVHSTGFRTPNGMGILPDGRLTASDNQGSWMPASKVSLLKPGGFYGYVQTHVHKQRLWAPDGGRIDHTKVVPPKTFDQPIIWMPQDFDNSSGGQLWVDDPRWGPLSGRLLHTSFGKGWLYYMMLQEIDGQDQAAIVRLKIDALTGIHRARVNPADGQVYATGLNGWNGHGRKGLSQGHIHRFRYTGKSARLLTDTKVLHNGIELKFNFPLDPDAATDPARYQLKQWNYKWTAGYGSKQYSPTTGKVGPEDIVITRVKHNANKNSVFLEIPTIRPVNQVKMNLNLSAVDGGNFQELVYLTINNIPGK